MPMTNQLRLTNLQQQTSLKKSLSFPLRKEQMLTLRSNRKSIRRLFPVLKMTRLVLM